MIGLRVLQKGEAPPTGGGGGAVQPEQLLKHTVPIAVSPRIRRVTVRETALGLCARLAAGEVLLIGPTVYSILKVNGV